MQLYERGIDYIEWFRSVLRVGADSLWFPTQTSNIVSPFAQLDDEVRSAVAGRPDNEDIQWLFVGHIEP